MIRLLTSALFASIAVAPLVQAEPAHRSPLPGKVPSSTPLNAVPERDRLQPPSPQQGETINAPAVACPVRLAALGLDTRAASIVTNQSNACTVIDPIILVRAHSGPGDTRIAFPDSPIVSCAMAEAFGIYVRDILAPLAKGTFNQPVASIDTGPGFECRTRNHVAGAKISSHAQGNALDIAGITLADGTKIVIEAPADEPSRRFVFGLRSAGCGAFSTVLGPGSDAFHANHLHFDIEARGRDGKSKFCQ